MTSSTDPRDAFDALIGATGGLTHVTVIGCGLIGTSIALALTGAGVTVTLEDRSREALETALRMGAGWELTEDMPPADLVVVATPPSVTVDTLYEAQARGLGHAYTDVASAKEHIWTEAELRGADLLGYVPGHPMAGRELSGPAAAQADLFEGRPWILCPYPTVEPRALEAVAALVALCGGVRRDMGPAEHDRAVAALSHAPQLVSSALAAQLAGLEREVLALAGTGVRDTTRIAGSDPRMWGDILGQNATAVADEVERIAAELALTARALRERGTEGAAATADLRVADLLGRGNEGRTALVAAGAVAGSGAVEGVGAGSGSGSASGVGSGADAVVAAVAVAGPATGVSAGSAATTTVTAGVGAAGGEGSAAGAAPGPAAPGTEAGAAGAVPGAGGPVGERVDAGAVTGTAAGMSAGSATGVGSPVAARTGAASPAPTAARPGAAPPAGSVAAHAVARAGGRGAGGRGTGRGGGRAPARAGSGRRARPGTCPATAVAARGPALLGRSG
ncbi:prephenate dehydrogenase [Streptomyces sp. NPDC097619]|uniref:prephenate dehydrogenase n=1 Tax=Streptomyces sp. NPDC097619 TaxID=3157228 RepID=UPI00332364B9